MRRKMLITVCVSASLAMLVLWLVSHLSPRSAAWRYSQEVWLLGDVADGSLTIGLIRELISRPELQKVYWEDEAEWYRHTIQNGVSDSERTELFEQAMDALKTDTWKTKWHGEARRIPFSVHRRARVIMHTGRLFEESLWVDLPFWIPFLLCAVYPTVILVRGPYVFRERYRRKHGLCVRCAYDLTANISGVCPECGTKVDSSKPHR